MLEKIRMTKDEWTAKAKALFGENHMKWRFVCPACGHVQSVEDFYPYKDKGASPSSATCECIGRYDGHMGVVMGSGQPCNYAAFGLFHLSPVIVIDGGKEEQCFAFDEAISV